MKRLHTTITPKILHQTWKTKNVPDYLQDYVKSCQQLHPDYQYLLWTDEDLNEFIHTNYPQFAKAYDSFQANIERVDFARYAILYKIGGVYADLDIQCTRSLDEWVNLNVPVLASEPIEHRERLYNSEPYVLCNALMISPPAQSVWLHIMQNIVQKYKKSANPVYNTGPMAVTRAFKDNVDAFKHVLFVSACSFYPQTDHMSKKSQNAPNGQAVHYISRECDLKDAYTIHRWAHTWIPPVKQRNSSSNGTVSSGYLYLAVLLLALLIVIICYQRKYCSAKR